MLTLNDGRSELWQWDTGRTLTVDADCSQVHFSNKVFGRSIDVDVVDGVAIIPDVLLQTDKDLNVWAFVGTAENGYTKISKTFKVNRRNKPADYVFTPPDQTTLGELVERLGKIEESQDPDAIKNAVDDYLANNPIMVKETDPTVPEWAKQPTPPDVKIPDKLPNPHSITFTGAVDASYDGSNPVEIKIPDSGGNVAYDEEQELTEEQKAQARANIGAIGSPTEITTQCELVSFIASNQQIQFNDRGRGCLIKVKENTLYKITVRGEHNRFYVSGCLVEEIKTGASAITIYQSGRSASTTETETYTVNSEGYKSLMVTVSYGLDNPNVSVEYTETKDGSLELNGTEVYTARKVDQLIEPLAMGGLVYTTNSDVTDVATTAKIYELYDALVTKYPTYITKNVLGQNSKGTSVCEYVFTSGNYNEVATMRTKDDIIVKPTVLVISGVHGYERSAVMATYQFFRDLANYLPILYPLREGFIFKVIPVVTPYAFDHDIRVNENGVNINRNFNCNWQSTANDGIDYSGEAAADQAETQIIQTWLEANVSAALFVDHHNSGYANEVSMVSGLNAADMVSEIKGLYLQGLTKVIPYWKTKKGFTDTLVFAYTGFIGGKAMSTDYAQDKGITSICLETSWNQNSFGLHSAESVAVSAEVLGNMLLAVYDKIAIL